jgi:hypothetical protein
MPGNRIRYRREMYRAANNRIAPYVEDVSPIGARVVKATTNGFAFRVDKISSNSVTNTFNLTAMDPSYNPSTDVYSWKITKFTNNSTGGATQTILPITSGLTTQVTLDRSQPVVIELTRTRNGVPEVLRILDRVNDLDRNNGNQFYKSLP